jgi:hypothetical protein
MAISYKVLGQVKPSAATATTLYTVPTGSGNYAVVSTLTICNITGDIDEFNISVRPAGATQEDKHYIVYESGIGPYISHNYTLGLTLASTDVVTVYSTNGKCSFNLFGSENS